MHLHDLRACLCGLVLVVVACGSDDSSGGPGSGTPSTSAVGTAGHGGASGSGNTGAGTGGVSSAGGSGGASSGGGSAGAAGSLIDGGAMDAHDGASSDVRSDANVPADGGPNDAGDGAIACPAAPVPPCTATNFAGKLRCIPGVQVQTSTMPPPPGYQRFDLTIDQPVDHANPNGAKFAQRIVLLHKSQTAPMVLSTSGYGLVTAMEELTSTFGANQISIEHRYFTPSIPAAPAPWEFLTIEQSAADSHHIWESFKWLYTGKWVNTGASKGGETAVYHRRFYPCDVDATVAYVAPLVYGIGDARFVAVQQNAGGPANATCRTQLVDFVKACLNRRSELVGRLNATQYTKLGVGPGYEIAVADVYWAFWQYQPASMCRSIPAATAPADSLFAFLTKIGVVEDGQDTSIDYFAPYVYQVTNQLGSPASWEDPWKSLLQYPDIDDGLDPFLPVGATRPAFRPEPMVDVQNWVKTSGQRLMFIYGEFDPWTGGKYDLGNAADAFEFVAPGGNHGSAIVDLAAADKEQALSTLERWLATRRIPPAPIFTSYAAGERRRFPR